MPVFNWGTQGGALGLGGTAAVGEYGPNPDILQGWMYGGKQQLANQKDIAGIQAGAGVKESQIGANASMYPATLKQDRFNTVFPFLQKQWKSFMPGGNMFATAGGQSGPSPEISVGPVWSGQQIQQNVNATRAQNDQAMKTQMKGTAEDLSGRGFGSNSPLLQSLYGQQFANNLATNTQAEQQLRSTAAQQNSQHILDSQQARETQFANRQREDIERRKPIWSTYNTLLSSLTGLV